MPKSKLVPKKLYILLFQELFFLNLFLIKFYKIIVVNMQYYVL